MGDVLKIPDEYRQVQWAAAIQKCTASGLSNKKYCIQHGLSDSRPPISSTPVGAARSRPGRQVGDPYQAQKLLACSNQRDTTYSPFTLTCYLRPRRWAMPGGFGNQRIGTGLVASLSAAQLSPPLVSSMYQVGRGRELTYSYKLRSVIVCRH